MVDLTSQSRDVEIKKLSPHLFWDIDADQLIWGKA